MSIHTKVRRFGALLVTAVMTTTCFVGLTVAQGGTAHAATNYAALCGANFVHKQDFSTPGGVLKVYRKGTGTGTDWCAFTVKQIKVGVPSYVIVHLDEAAGWYSNSNTEADSGDFRYYAGPVRKYNRKWVYVEGRVSGTGYIDGSSYYVSN